MMRFVIVFVVLQLSACTFYRPDFIRGSKNGRHPEPTPPGMVVVPAGVLISGQDDPEKPADCFTPSRKVSVASFWMDETEVTNRDYRRFTDWVMDSLRRQCLADEGFDEFLMKDEHGIPLHPPRLNWNTRMDLKRNEDYIYVLRKKLYDREGKFNVYNMVYEYSWYDYRQAVLNEKYYDVATGGYTGGYVVTPDGEVREVTGPSSFLMKKRVFVYPDTLCWLKDFAYAYLDPYAESYFSHPAYDDHPVVGVNWHQAQAFCHWKTRMSREKGGGYAHVWRLPTEAEWEYAARGGLVRQLYPWVGDCLVCKNGCFPANFRFSEGEYTLDGGLITTPVGRYKPNGYGLSDMAGNVAEWTADDFEESAHWVVHDMNPYYRIDRDTLNLSIRKRKVIRGGSWKESASFLQNASRTYEFRDSARCYIGFRTVMSR